MHQHGQELASTNEHMARYCKLMEELAPVANRVLGRLAEAALVAFCSARRRSLGVPCLSPFMSFLKAKETVMALHSSLD